MKKRIITVAGRPGSGKSSTAKSVAEELGYRHFSSGDLFRQLAKEHGLELLKANQSAERHSRLDELVDRRVREIGEHEDRLVIDSRMAWHWIPGSYKVFLDLDLATAAERILAGMRESGSTNEQIPDDPTAYSKVLQQRLDSETFRYQSKYQVDAYDLGNYDLVVDTRVHDLEGVVAIILAGFQDWLKR